jgi:hypothetical protein
MPGTDATDGAELPRAEPDVAVTLVSLAPRCAPESRLGDTEVSEPSVSACADPGPATTAAPSPTVTTPAPSQA